MINILQAQLFRLKKSKLFWTLLILCAAMPTFAAVLLYGIQLLFENMEDVSILDLLGMSITALTILSNFSQPGSDSGVLAIICAAVVLSREFTQGTMRNVLLANKSRTQMFLANFITSLIVGMSYFVVEFLFTLLFYGLLLGFGPVSGGAVVSAALCFFVMGISSMLFAQTCVCMFVFSVRKSAASAILPLVICLIAPNLIANFESIIIMGVEASGKIVSDTVISCLPFMSSQALFPEKPASLAMVMTILYNLLFAGGFFCLGFFPFQKADLK